LHTIVERKKADRKLASATRGSLFDANACTKAASNFFNSIELPTGTIISLYLPIGTEIGTAPLFDGLKVRGITTLLPIVEGKDQPLIFKKWSVGDPLEKGHFDVSVPNDQAKRMVPNILLVPLLAFDARGYRLGYGGGFYDRTLEAFRADGSCVAIGYAYAGQEVAHVTIDNFDQPLDWLVTEKEVRKIL